MEVKAEETAEGLDDDEPSRVPVHTPVHVRTSDATERR
jgi:hypothetical protein